MSMLIIWGGMDAQHAMKIQLIIQHSHSLHP